MILVASPKTMFFILMWSFACRPIIGGGCGFIPRQSDFQLTQDILEYSLVSVDLSELTYEKGLVGQHRRGELKHDFDKFQVWRDRDNSDLAVLAAKNGVCYAAFRGTISWNIRDYLQVHAQSERTVGECGVRRGFVSLRGFSLHLVSNAHATAASDHGAPILPLQYNAYYAGYL